MNKIITPKNLMEGLKALWDDQYGPDWDHTEQLTVSTLIKQLGAIYLAHGDVEVFKAFDIEKSPKSVFKCTFIGNRVVL